MAIPVVISGLAVISEIANLIGWLSCRLADNDYKFSPWIFAGPYIYRDKVIGR